MKLFFSYSHDDKSYVRELSESIRKTLDHDIWLDKKLAGGQKWWNEILDQIEKCDVFIYILSPLSVSSIFCVAEYTYALALNKPFLPIELKKCVIPSSLNAIQYIEINDLEITQVSLEVARSLASLEKEKSRGDYTLPSNPISRPSVPQPSDSGYVINGKLVELPPTFNIDEMLKNQSVHTQRAYKRCAREFFAFVNKIDQSSLDMENIDSRLVIGSLSQHSFELWINTLSENGLSSSTITASRAAILWFVDSLVELGCVSYTLSYELKHVKIPSSSYVPQKREQIFSTSKIASLINYIEENGWNTLPARQRNICMIKLIAYCGLSRSEVASLEWKDYDSEKKTLIIGGPGKLRTLSQIPQEVLDAIEKWRSNINDYDNNQKVFTRILKNGVPTKYQITDKSVSMVVRDVGNLLGLQSLSPEDLRRSFARNAYDAKMPLEKIQHILGHSSINSTVDYIRVNSFSSESGSSG